MQEMLRAPIILESVVFPLHVHVQESKVVALSHVESLAGRIALLLPLLGPVEYGGDTKHTHNREHLLGAPVFRAHNQDLGHAWLHRKLAHLATQLGEVANMVQSAQDPKLVHTREQIILGGWIHKVEFEQVFHSESLE